MSLVINFDRAYSKRYPTCGLGSADTVASSLAVDLAVVCFPLSLILADFLEPTEGWGSPSAPPSFPPPPPPPLIFSVLVER